MAARAPPAHAARAAADRRSRAGLSVRSRHPALTLGRIGAWYRHAPPHGWTAPQTRVARCERRRRRVHGGRLRARRRAARHGFDARADGAPVACPTCSGARARFSTIATRRGPSVSTATAPTASSTSVYRINQRGDFDIALDRMRSLPAVGWLVPYGAFLWAGLRYDHFGFFFDGGLLGGPGAAIELPLLRAAGKGIVVYPYGGDARVGLGDTRARSVARLQRHPRRRGGLGRARRDGGASRSSAAGPTSSSAAPTSWRTSRGWTAFSLYPFDATTGSPCPKSTMAS